ncbi:MAG: hypothetical protein ACTHMT_15425 [Verrucomicrobiota bacterium]
MSNILDPNQVKGSPPMKEARAISLFSSPGRLLEKAQQMPYWAGAFFLFCAGMGAMLTITYLIRPWMGIDLALGNDAYDGYLQLAQNLLRGFGYVFEPGGHKVFHRPPVYPVLLMPGALLPEVWARIYVAALNSLLLAFAGHFTRKLASEVFNGKTGIIAWAILGFNPFILWSVKNPMAPICQTLAFVLVLFCCWRILVRIGFKPPYAHADWERRQTPAFGLKLWIGSLACFLGAVLCHGTMLADAGLLLGGLALFAAKHGKWRSFAKICALGVAVLIGIAPWTWRNYKVTGIFIPVVGNSGLAYFAGNGHWGIGKPGPFIGEDPRMTALRHAGYYPEDFSEMLEFYGLSDIRWEKEFNKRFVEDAKAHPELLLKKIGLNALEYYFPLIYQFFPPPNSYIRVERDAVPLTLYHLVLVLLGCTGLAYLLRRKEGRIYAVLLLFCWAIYAVPYFPFLSFVGHGLYTFGTIPVLAIAVGVGIARPLVGQS